MLMVEPRGFAFSAQLERRQDLIIEVFGEFFDDLLKLEGGQDSIARPDQARPVASAPRSAAFMTKRRHGDDAPYCHFRASSSPALALCDARTPWQRARHRMSDMGLMSRTAVGGVAFLAGVALEAGGLLGASSLPQAHTFQAYVSARVGGFVADGDATILVPPLGTSRDATIKVADTAAGVPAPAPTIPFSMSAGNPYQFSVMGGSILKPLTLTLPVSEPASSEPGSQVFAAYYDDSRASWVPVSSEIDRGRSVLRVRTMHTSWWKVWTWNFAALRAGAKTAFRVLSQALGVRAPPPQCQPMDPHATVIVSSIVRACFEGSAAGPGTLRVVDNRSYALLIEIPAGLHRGETHGVSLADAARQWMLNLIAPNASFVPAGEEIAFAIPAPSGSWSFPIRPSVLTFGVDLLITVARLVVPGFEQAKAVLDTLDCLQTDVQTERAIHGATELEASLGTPLLNVVFDCLGQTPLANPVTAAISQVRTAALQVIGLADIVNDNRQGNQLQLVRSPASG
jgi:hypothetical protein